ncbi:hypothetical protein ACR79N_26850 [Sphingobacterium siyangense]|uniref:hypothetical protein n=1 Tax=Sphingobacterium siyangense TaxID=459529 RepID=UPI003DA37059
MQLNDNESSTIFICVPNIPEIIPQVLKCDGTSFESYWKLGLEHLYYSEKIKGYFNEIEVTEGVRYNRGF